MEQTIFNKLRRIVYDESGIWIKEGNVSMVAARIGRRIRERGKRDILLIFDEPARPPTRQRPSTMWRVHRLLPEPSRR